MKNRQANNGVIAGNGIKGSLRKREVTQPQQHTEYYLFNSQGNLKAYSDDIMNFAYYGYNAANTRTYKLSLYNTNIWINGQQQPLNMQLQNAMFYPNTYLNFDAFGNYTKHYYNGTERIASRLGDNNTTIAIDNMLENRKLLLEEQVRNDIQELISEPMQVDMPPMLDILNLQPIGTPNDIYYYHPNHLGSTSFVTDQNQTITQGFLYAPFGEITTEFNINFGSSVIPKYSFNAKELDEETGFYYYEARYYNPPTFISRDPLMSEKPWLTPYHYCSNNPVGRVDPSGMMDEENPVFSKDGKLLGTDSRGWKGIPIVMDESDYYENMDGEAAVKAGKATSLNEYGEGISISEKDWALIEKHGGNKIFPFLSNRTNETIYYKPDKTVKGFLDNEAYPVYANMDLYLPFDGIKTVGMPQDMVYKVVDGTKAVIYPNNSLLAFIVGTKYPVMPIINLKFNGIKGLCGHILKGGLINTPDENWDALSKSIRENPFGNL
ncbi:MAG: RHS repeat-associated core domain-containing protein [Bacteroidales bacterium]|nr:RHS repeat-associated core domain-containing protein [Bacteroidales bacterium]